LQYIEKIFSLDAQCCAKINTFDIKVSLHSSKKAQLAKSLSKRQSLDTKILIRSVVQKDFESSILDKEYLTVIQVPFV
jgi:hypothetical protein